MTKGVMRMVGIILAVCTLITCSTGCSSGKAAVNQKADITPQTGSNTSRSVTQATLTDVVNYIYSHSSVNETYDLTYDTLLTSLDISGTDVEAYAGRISTGKFGLADAIIIKPVSEDKQAVVNALYKYQVAKEQEAKNWDVFDSYAVARDYVTIDINGYVGLIMIKGAPDLKASVIDMLRSIQ